MRYILSGIAVYMLQKLNYIYYHIGAPQRDGAAVVAKMLLNLSVYFILFFFPLQLSVMIK